MFLFLNMEASTVHSRHPAKNQQDNITISFKSKRRNDPAKTPRTRNFLTAKKTVHFIEFVLGFVWVLYSGDFGWLRNWGRGEGGVIRGDGEKI